MSLYVLDTDIVTLYWEGDPLVRSRVDACPREDLAITVITVEEELNGWYSLIRRLRRPPEVARAYHRLGEAIPFLAGWRILTYTEPAMARAQQLHSQRLNVRRNDLRIAAIVLENDGTVVTRNVRDFQRVPGLRVENWAA